jgi:predicted ATP-dependent endonuclease of OLD family
MHISNVKIQNYRNIRKLDCDLGKTVVISGENNSGKSNFLRAITLPFLAEESGYSGKSLYWVDINSEARAEYYQYLLSKKDDIKNGNILIEDFSRALPVIAVEVQIHPEAKEKYYVKDIASDIDSSDIRYRLRYEFRPKKVKEILSAVRDILLKEEISEENIQNIQLSLLPVDMYEYSIFVPGKGTVSYDVLRQFRYMLLAAERDDFSTTNDKIGSKSLVKLLQMKLNDKDKLTVEKKYSEFFETLKNLSGMENILNWQKVTEIDNAEEFFKNISILPNMPPMSSILNSVRLGYNDENLSLQGLGQRNMILLLVLINSLFEKSENIPLRLIAIEEPEAHLCINNIKLVASFMQAFTADSSQLQTFCTTHSTEFINKLSFEDVIIMNGGNGYALRTELDEKARNYLSKNPN